MAEIRWGADAASVAVERLNFCVAVYKEPESSHVIWTGATEPSNKYSRYGPDDISPTRIIGSEITSYFS